jgi:hypothetical protein
LLQRRTQFGEEQGLLVEHAAEIADGLRVGPALRVAPGTLLVEG